MVWSQFSIKILGVNIGNSVFDISNWDKISHSLTKKIQYVGESATLFGMKQKKTIVNQILLSKLWYLGRKYTIQKFIIQEIEKSNGSTIHLEVSTRYFRHRFSIKLPRT